MTTIIDLTNNHEQVENNGVTIVNNAGRFPGTKALYFDGNSYINFPTNAACVKEFPACIEAWVKPEINNIVNYDRQNSFNSYGIITKGRPIHNSGNNFGLYLHRYPLDHIFMLKSYSSTGLNSISSSRVITSTYTPQWYHIALTIEQSGSNYVFKMYINGSLAGSDTQPSESTNLTSDDQYLTIGAYKSYHNGTYSLSNKFKGYMTDIRLTYGDIIYSENFGSNLPGQSHRRKLYTNIPQRRVRIEVIANDIAGLVFDYSINKVFIDYIKGLNGTWYNDASAAGLDYADDNHDVYLFDNDVVLTFKLFDTDNSTYIKKVYTRGYSTWNNSNYSETLFRFLWTNSSGNIHDTTTGVGKYLEIIDFEDNVCEYDIRVMGVTGSSISTNAGILFTFSGATTSQLEEIRDQWNQPHPTESGRSLDIKTFTPSGAEYETLWGNGSWTIGTNAYGTKYLIHQASPNYPNHRAYNRGETGRSYPISGGQISSYTAKSIKCID